MDSNERIKTFVIDVLGCACPDDVFKYVHCELVADATEAATLQYKIDIGNRLLIHVIETDDRGFVAAQLAALFDAGRAEREARAFHRFRLVIATNDPPAMEATVRVAAVASDDRAHLHVVTKDAVADLLW